MGTMVKLLLGIQLFFATNVPRDGRFITEELSQKSKRIDVQLFAQSTGARNLILVLALISICIATVRIAITLLRLC